MLFLCAPPPSQSRPPVQLCMLCPEGRSFLHRPFANSFILRTLVKHMATGGEAAALACLGPDGVLAVCSFLRVDDVVTFALSCKEVYGILCKDSPWLWRALLERSVPNGGAPPSSASWRTTYAVLHRACIGPSEKASLALVAGSPAVAINQASSPPTQQPALISWAGQPSHQLEFRLTPRVCMCCSHNTQALRNCVEATLWGLPGGQALGEALGKPQRPCLLMPSVV